MPTDTSPFPTSPRERNEQTPLGPQPSYDHALDVAVEYTFPASDPIAVDSCCTSAERAAAAKAGDARRERGQDNAEPGERR
jgi:hypothetical protein